MSRKGVPEKVGMLISGHKTDSVYRRYNIVDMEVLKTATTKIEQHQREIVQAENNHRTAIVSTKDGADDKTGTKLQFSIGYHRKPEWRNWQTRRTSKSTFLRVAIQFIAYPAAFHASTPPFNTMTFFIFSLYQIRMLESASMITDDEKAKLRFELANANVQSIGRAQGIYVTVLLAYICLVWGASFVGGNEISFHIGPFDLKVDGVWGITPFVLLFLTLIYIGSLTAAAPALDHLQEAENELFGSRAHSLSEFDTHKNVLDYLGFLQLDPRGKAHARTDDDQPQSVASRVRYLILPLLFVGSAFTSFWGVYESYQCSYYAAFIFGGCCLLLQVAYSVRPVWRGVRRLLGAKQTSDVFH